MERQITITGDGSHTVFIPELNASYHSIYGAIQESTHVFIRAGLNEVFASLKKDTVRIFEIGFGTGLNALLTLIEAEKSQKTIHYETTEQSPLDDTEIKSLNYCKQLLRPELQMVFEHLHQCDWEKEVMISSGFYLRKTKQPLQAFHTSTLKNLIYFDPFDPNIQPELWTEDIFNKMFSILEADGILVTYCSKGIARRAMQSAGFIVEKLAGPPRKREIVRARKKI